MFAASETHRLVDTTLFSEMIHLIHVEDILNTATAEQV